MKAAEKEIIFDLLKKSDAYVNGFSSKAFNINPVFSDDEVSKADDKVSVATPTEEVAAEVEAPVPHGLTIKEISDKVSRCTRCGLARTRTNVVPGVGVENPEVLVIGEGPGYDEDIKGEPFVGKAGILLDKMLNAINLDRKTNCYIANIVKCRPPENRNPNPDEVSACIGFLEAQINILKPKMILCMGLVAGHSLLKIDTPMNNMHGVFYEYKDIPVMVTYHPSALLRNEQLKRPAWADLKLFRGKLDLLRDNS